MQKFSEFLNDYKEFKLKEHNSSEFDKYDMMYVRESYAALVKAERDAKKIKESKEAEAKAENKEPVQESVKETAFQKALKEFAAFKESKGYGPVTRAERVKIFEKTRSEKSKIVESKVTVQGVFNKLAESKKCVALAQKRLSEGDVMGAADATMAAGAAVTGAEGDANALATPTAPVPQEVVDQISQVKSAVDALAASAGIASPVDMGADPNAGVPAVTGAPVEGGDVAPADPNAGMAPVAESSTARLDASAQRIEESKIEESKIEESKDESKPGVVVPPVETILKGTVSGASKEAAPADTWPTKPLNDVPAGKKLGNVKESEEFSPDTEENKTEALEESKGLAEQRLEAELAKRNFKWSDFLKSGFNKR